MDVCLVTPAAPRSRKGNRTTALRWTRILRSLGHRVHLVEAYEGGDADVLVALHARRSAPSIERFRTAYPDRPVILALTGTDLYRDIHSDDDARASLERADRFVVLQELGAAELPERLRPRVRTIYQSAVPPPGEHPPDSDAFEVVVLSHLREVKDPLRTAYASRLLPDDSRIRVVHLGVALDPELGRLAEDETLTNPRYDWRGRASRSRALRTLARSRLLALTSRSEGGANVVSEALACGVPVVSSRIPGSVGMLGEDYPGYFDVGDTEGLAELLRRAEADEDLYGELYRRCVDRAGLVERSREREAWASLLAEVTSERGVVG